MSLSRRFEETVAARSRSLGASAPPEVLAVVSRAARGKRRLRALRVAGTAAGSVMVVVAGAWIVVNQPSDPLGPLLPVSPSLSVTPSAPVTASPSPSPSTSEPEALVAATDRGAGYPDAFLITPSVLAQVGAGWNVDSYSQRWNPYVEDQVATSGVIYLVSPEGLHYEAAVLTEPYSGGLRVVSWHEESATVHVMWEGGGPTSAPAGAAIVSLRDGAVAEFPSIDAAGAKATSPLAIEAGNNELWLGHSSGGTGYFAYSPDGGWTKSAMFDAALAQPDLRPANGTVAQLPSARSDGEAVLFEVREDRGTYGWAAPSELWVYSLDDDALSITPPRFRVANPEMGSCDLTAPWTDRAIVAYECSSETPPDDNQEVLLLGAPPLSSQPPTSPSFAESDEAVGLSSRVGFGLATDPFRLFYFCTC